MPWLTLLTNKWMWVLAALVASNIYTGIKAYDYARLQNAKIALEETIKINENNLEIARRREAELMAAIEKYNLAARKDAEQKALDDKLLEEYDREILELQDPDGQCFGPDDTDRLRKHWNQADPSS